MAGQGNSWGKRCRNSRGAVAVEFALVLPLLMMLVFGIITSGLSYTHAIGLTNAVREGARFGATDDATASTWADDVIARVRATQFDDSTDPTKSTTAVCVRLVQAPSTVSTISSGTSACSTSSNTPSLSLASPPAMTGITAGSCVVQVWAARDFQISILVASPWNGTAVKTSVAQYERGSC